MERMFGKERMFGFDRRGVRLSPVSTTTGQWDDLRLDFILFLDFVHKTA